MFESTINANKKFMLIRLKLSDKYSIKMYQKILIDITFCVLLLSAANSKIDKLRNIIDMVTGNWYILFRRLEENDAVIYLVSIYWLDTNLSSTMSYKIWKNEYTSIIYSQEISSKSKQGRKGVTIQNHLILLLALVIPLDF